MKVILTQVNTENSVMTHNIAEKECQIHEHNGHVCFHLTGTQTIRITPEMAEKMAVELALASKQIRNGYHYQTKTIGE